ncbi:hypothetical protein CC1G_01009 [Coprinopsis cinerea okayama7|uniref:Uncharacterized protein n=1 Tax=Coprinopsis cinerea (strain Okayama-7 / 130 / ATCC MYA-4618 / FGSC 9003) TaxID=240176 RepID=A8NE68_COPC7|nr:hypothetical protein CC1G_01009 [Coprinopsis cinerea okayama7\|eukprot:XP_001832947.1 hypothetical protein CC1G_01009 [Coprinopsis cinerea okayama7\
MPSLRRTASSPSVRSSPYGYSSSLSGAQAARGHGHRRSSGSEITNRRVLADIEWWRVTAGQCEPGAGDLESEERTSDVVQNNVTAGGLAGAAFFEPSIGVEHLWAPSALWPTTDTSFSVPVAEFAALSIAPQTPVRRARHDGLESSASSLESTPEPALLTFEGLCLGLSDMDMHGSFFEDDAPLASVLQLDSGIATGSPRPLTRAHTFADCLSLQDDFANCFTDSPIPPLLSLPALIN